MFAKSFSYRMAPLPLLPGCPCPVKGALCTQGSETWRAVMKGMLYLGSKKLKRFDIEIKVVSLEKQLKAWVMLKN